MEKFFPSSDCVCEQHDLLGLAWITDATAGSATDAIWVGDFGLQRTQISDSDSDVLALTRLHALTGVEGFLKHTTLHGSVDRSTPLP